MLPHKLHLQRLLTSPAFLLVLMFLPPCFGEEKSVRTQSSLPGFDYQWLHRQAPVNASLRGSAASGRGVAWVTGTSGTILRSTNGGESWVQIAVPDLDNVESGNDQLNRQTTGHDSRTPTTESTEPSMADFRDVAVLADGSVLFMSGGTGRASRVIRLDAGTDQWRVVLENENPHGFFDGFDFDASGQFGVLYGDAVEGRFDLYQTEDAGKTWTQLSRQNRPSAKPGEHAFAASGTGIEVDGSIIRFVTGGSVARVATSTDRGSQWTFTETPIPSGKPSAGIFSLAMLDENQIVVVGGDYLAPESTRATTARTNNGGQDWEVSPSLVPHRACVRHLGGDHLLSCGRTGVAVSMDAGQHWTTISKEGYYTAAVDQTRQCAFLAGSEGRIVVLQWKRQRSTPPDERSAR